MEIARKMLKENFSIETISRITELSIEEIEVLRENLAEDTTTVYCS
jgi:predicted transposase YdaD